MLRLLQGDVGSGKTAVAAAAMACVADADRQAALLAPTDLLARQHATTLAGFLEPLGHGVTLLTGSLRPAARRAALDAIGAPSRGLDGRSEGLVVVGTHALVEEAVAFHDLALAVIDEQHRFGVAQREALGAKGASPHVLLMTATPIPQTLGRILHADLDVTDLRAAPVGRQSIATGIRRTGQLVWRTKDVPGQPDQPGAYPLLLGEVAAGRRAFVVVPLVEEDPDSGARSAQATASMLGDVLPGVAQRFGIAVAPRIGVVHGQMPARTRDEVMDRFRAGELDILVGTTVIEVGVDVPEATVMLIFDADRFGLAQLHQLRGRVGRGADRSYCILVSDAIEGDEVARARLEAVAATQDGFALAEKDLELRREGELLGLTQSGLPPLRIATLADPADQRRSVEARAVAEALVDEAGALLPGHEALAREMTSGWLRRVGAGEALAEAEDGGGRRRRIEAQRGGGRWLTPAASSPARPAASASGPAAPPRDRWATGSSRPASASSRRPRWGPGRPRSSTSSRGAAPVASRRSLAAHHGRPSWSVIVVHSTRSAPTSTPAASALAPRSWPGTRWPRSAPTPPPDAVADGPFGAALLDPPYGDATLMAALDRLAEPAAGWLAEEAVVVAKHFWRDVPAERFGRLVRVRERRFGETTLSFYVTEPQP